MKLYRLAHHNIAYRLRDQPEAGFMLCKAGPYFSAFDSVAAAILESHIYRECHVLPASMRVVEYKLPDDYRIIEKRCRLRPAIASISDLELGESAHQFLEGGVSLVASFMSNYWRDQTIFLINPRNPDFKELTVTMVSPCV